MGTICSLRQILIDVNISIDERLCLYLIFVSHVPVMYRAYVSDLGAILAQATLARFVRA